MQYIFKLRITFSQICEVADNIKPRFDLKSALQFVNEILKEIENNFLQRYNSVDRYYYWQEVKEEIENL